MALDDRMERAASELRQAVSGRAPTAIGRVRRRIRAQRLLAFAGGAVLVLVTVGVAALAGGDGASGDLVPVGEGDTTTIATTSTTISAVTAPSAPTSQPIPTSTTTILEGDGLTGLTGLPEGWLEDMGETARILLAFQGLGIAATPLPDSPDAWDLVFVEGRRFDAALDFGSDYGPGRTAQLGIRFLVDADDTTITAYGVAPLGTLRIDLHVMPSDFPLTISFGSVWQRPEVGVAVFVGQFDGSILVDLSPVEFELELTTSAELGPEHERLFSTFGYKGGWVRDGYDGPFTADRFVEPMELVLDSIDVAAFPEVVGCDAPPGVEPPPNQGRTISDGAVLPTPLAAFEQIIHQGELSDSQFPHRGYLEMRDPDGNVAFGKPLDGDSVAAGVVVLVEIVEVESGWTVFRWEASGC